MQRRNKAQPTAQRETRPANEGRGSALAVCATGRSSSEQFRAAAAVMIDCALVLPRKID